jgi:hypothetical protein
MMSYFKYYSKADTPAEAASMRGPRLIYRRQIIERFLERAAYTVKWSSQKHTKLLEWLKFVDLDQLAQQWKNMPRPPVVYEPTLKYLRRLPFWCEATFIRMRMEASNAKSGFDINFKRATGIFGKDRPIFFSISVLSKAIPFVINGL